MGDLRLGRVLTTDPGISVADDADAGHDLALEAAPELGMDLPMSGE